MGLVHIVSLESSFEALKPSQARQTTVRRGRATANHPEFPLILEYFELQQYLGLLERSVATTVTTVLCRGYVSKQTALQVHHARTHTPHMLHILCMAHPSRACALTSEYLDSPLGIHSHFW